MATIKDVAEKAGVSVATVSAVINTDSNVNVSNKLKVRVEEAIRELNYRPNRIAQALSTNKTRILAYVVPTIKNTFFSQMAHFIEDEAFEKGYGVYLCITQSKAERVKLYLDNLIENRVAGVIVTLTWEILDNNFIETVLKENIPIVGIAGARMFNNIDTVITDDVEGTEIAIKHLIARGHERIGFIGTINSKTTEQRIAGYLNAIKESHFNYDDKSIIHSDLVPRVSENVMRALLRERRFPRSEAKISPPSPRKDMQALVAPIPSPSTNRNLPTKPQIYRAPSMARPNINQPVSNAQSPSSDYGKITPLLNDPSVSSIECPGEGKPLTIIRSGQMQMTKIVLNKKEIKEILEQISEAAHIPILEGVFRAAVDNFSISAVVSEIIGSKFIIKKSTPYSMLER